MERGRRTGWTGGPRPQQASASAFRGSLKAAVDRRSSPHRSACSAEFLAFLPGTAQQVEFDATHSKQSIGAFLPGATMGCQCIEPRRPATPKLARVKQRNRYFIHEFRAFLTETDSQTELLVTRSKQSTDAFLTETRIASLAHGKSSNTNSKLSEGCAWLRL